MIAVTSKLRGTRHVRWMIRDDMPEVLDIERRSFDDPWSEEEFKKVLRMRNCIGFVVEGEHGRVVGYMIFELLPKRLNLLNIAVDLAHRRTGVGRMMVEKLVGKLSPERRTAITLTVSELNLEAQLFFRAMEFRCVKILRRPFEGCDEDGYVFRRRYGT